VFVRRFPGRAWIVFDTAVGLDVRRRDGVHVCSALDGEGRVPVLRPWECDLRASTDCANHCDRRPLLRGDYSVAYRFHRQYRAGRCKFWVLGVVKRRSCALRAFEQVTPTRWRRADRQDCYDSANLCIDMWNRSDEYANCSWLLRTADAWLQLAFELHKRL
jgi:hypothetical protein